MRYLIYDMETRSTANLKQCGSHAYTCDPTTDVLCVSYCIVANGVRGPITTWLPPNPVPPDILSAHADPDTLIVAFNDAFERQVEERILHSRYSWPIFPVERRRCAQAAALAYALPASLDKVAEALKLPMQKAATGKRAMRALAMPRKPRKDEDPAGTYWRDDPKLLETLVAYNASDVEITAEIVHRLGFLSPQEQKIWELDAVVNARGVGCDVELLDAALSIADQAATELKGRLATLTNGIVTSPAQVDRILEWLARHGCDLPNIQEETLLKALKVPGLSTDARQLIELRLSGAHAAVNKLATLRNWVGPDRRVRHAFRYHGAMPGRFTSIGVQLQNLKKPTIDDVGAALETVRTGSLAHMQARYERPLAVVGDITRGLVVPSPGHRLFIADLSGIESRGLAWLTNEQSKLDAWREFDRTGDLALEPYTRLAREFGLEGGAARGAGKVADLAFQYEGGAAAWRRLAPADDQTPEQKVYSYRDAWRRQHPNIRKFWAASIPQAMNAIDNPNQSFTVARIAFIREGIFLHLELPSGRRIRYPFARIYANERGDKSFTFRDASGGRYEWYHVLKQGRGAFGGLIAENATQALCRDIFVEAMLRLEAAGYHIVAHLHDEFVCEVPDGFGNLDEFRSIITTPPAWAPDFPIATKARIADRFIETKVAAPPMDQKVEPPRLFSAPSPDNDATVGPEGGVVTQNSSTISAATPPEAEPQAKLGAPDGDLEGENPTPELPFIGFPPPDFDDPPPRGNGHDPRAGNGFDFYATGELPRGPPTQSYIYKDAQGRLFMRVTRTSSKSFPTQHWHDGRWVYGWPATVVPYRLPELLAAPATEPVWICEGEKDSDNVAALGLVATTNPGGAAKWQPELAQWFKSKQLAYILEDNDDPGRKHTSLIQAALRDVVPSIAVISFPEFPEKSDVSDWLEAGGNKKLLLALAAQARQRIKSRRAYVTTNLATVTPRAVQWIWPGHLARGGLELLAGTPEIGKSQVHCQYLTCATTGRDWPDGKPGITPCRVIILTAEDTTDDTLVPRLKAAGANLKLIEQLNAIRRNERDEMFLLGEDLATLEQMIRDFGDIGLVAIDPITAFMGNDKHFDSHRATSVRAQLSPLKQLAERTGVAFSAPPSQFRYPSTAACYEATCVGTVVT